MVGKIIKSGDAPAPSEPSTNTAARMATAARRPVVDAEEYDAHTRAREILAQAEAQAAQIRARAQAEREGVLSQAREQGRQEGLAQVTELLAKAQLEVGQKLKALEPELVKLSIKVAERIIGAELATRDETIMQIVAKAVEQLRQSKELVIRVHPEDAEGLRQNKRKLLEYIGRLKDIAVREDPEVARGGCIIETESGTVDAQLSTQLEMIEQALLGGSQG